MFQIPTTGRALNLARELGAPLLDVPALLWRDRHGSTHTRPNCTATRGRKRAFDPRATLPHRWTLSMCESCEDWQHDRRWYFALQCARFISEYRDEVTAARRSMRQRLFTKNDPNVVAPLVMKAWLSTMGVSALLLSWDQSDHVTEVSGWLAGKQAEWLLEVDSLRAEFAHRYPQAAPGDSERLLVWMELHRVTSELTAADLQELLRHVLFEGLLETKQGPWHQQWALASVPAPLACRMSAEQLGPHLPTDGPPIWKVFRQLLEGMRPADALQAARGITA